MAAKLTTKKNAGRRETKKSSTPELQSLTFQDLIFSLQIYWSRRGCIIQQPYDVEVGAGTMHPETFFRVLGPNPYRVAYVQPSRRPADGRYGENPNRLYKHTQLQVILKPPPADVQNVYLESLRAIGIDLKHHDIRFEEDNWESPTLGAWGVGWQVLLDGLEITQFTYFQQSGGIDLDPVSCELTYGLERITAFLQNVDSIFDLRWSENIKYGDIRLAEEEQSSTYSFEWADPGRTRELFDLYEREARSILTHHAVASEGARKRPVPILAAYDLCLKCSHLFNILDARGAISTTERAALIARVRALTSRVASEYCIANGWSEAAGSSGAAKDVTPAQERK
ncbi:MAG TPA: glycine--tRNA ligase subunit alpha [Candidatus Acidoferrales bacterium]|nr:glycine--tRNA ligase subunit alpha [Candidatus Acidoferrales bacterium]